MRASRSGRAWAAWASASSAVRLRAPGRWRWPYGAAGSASTTVTAPSSMAARSASRVISSLIATHDPRSGAQPVPAREQPVVEREQRERGEREEGERDGDAGLGIAEEAVAHEPDHVVDRVEVGERLE